MVRLRVREDAGTVSNTAGFRIGRAIVQPCDPRVGDRRCAHRTRFQCHIKCCTGQPLGAERCTRHTQRKDFCVGGRVVKFTCPITRARQFDTVSTDYNRANWNFTPRGGGVGLG